MPVDKELTEFINKALGTVSTPNPRPRRHPRMVIRYRWNLEEGGWTRITEKEAEEILAKKEANDVQGGKGDDN